MSNTLRSLTQELLEALKSRSSSANSEQTTAEKDLIKRAESFLEVRNCWLDDGQIEQSALPDTCVFDNGQPHNCIYAEDLSREGKGKLDCEYWGAGQPLC